MHKLTGLPHATTRVYHSPKDVPTGVWQFPNNTLKQCNVFLMLVSVNVIEKHTNLFGQVYVNCLDASTNVNENSKNHLVDTLHGIQGIHVKTEVRTRLYNLDEDGKDIRLGLKQPVLRTETRLTWQRVGTSRLL
jgi:hypothetical protein